MSVNLLEMARGLFSPQTESTLSSVLNESESGVSKALSGIIPVIFGGLIHKSSDSAGASDLFGMATAESDNGILDNIGSFLGANDESGILGKGGGLLSSLFGNKSNGLIDIISNFSGVKSSSSKSLLSIALPAILGFIGKYIKNKGLDISGLSGVLASQKQNVQAALPPGLNLGDFSHLSFAQSTQPEPHVAAAATAHTSFREVQEEEESSGGGLRWLLPILLLALITAAALYFYKGCNNDTTDGHGSTTHETASSDDHSATHADPAGGMATLDPASLGAVDASGDFVYNIGNLVHLNLPDSKDTLVVGENSTEAKLIKFLQSSEAVDTAKGNWYNFTNVRFVTGKSEIQESSIAQLKNLVAISKAFPQAQFKIGGYTDNTGDQALNLQLSKDRAAAVLAKLKELGASAASITGSDGYGSQYPIGDNSTAEGRALNRRVAVNVKAK